MTPRFVVPPLQVTHPAGTFFADDVEHANQFAAALHAATRTPAAVRSTVRYCQAQECGRPIRGLLASCDNPVCVDATATAEERAYRWADE
jgi:hypothetical protein